VAIDYQELSYPYLRAWIKRQLGEPPLSVELSDEQLDDAIYEALRLWVTFVAPVKQEEVTLVPGKQVYQLERDKIGLGVVNVMRSDEIRDNSGVFLYSDTGMMYQYPYSANIGDFLLNRMYIEESRRVFGEDYKWEFNEMTGALYVNPPSTDGGTLVYEYIPEVGLEDVPVRAHDLIKRLSLAFAKNILGQIRGTFSTVPGNDGDFSLNGDDLKSEAKSELENLREELLKRYPSRVPPVRV